MPLLTCAEEITHLIQLTEQSHCHIVHNYFRQFIKQQRRYILERSQNRYFKLQNLLNNIFNLIKIHFTNENRSVVDCMHFKMKSSFQ